VKGTNADHDLRGPKSRYITLRLCVPDARRKPCPLYQPKFQPGSEQLWLRRLCWRHPSKVAGSLSSWPFREGSRAGVGEAGRRGGVPTGHIGVRRAVLSAGGRNVPRHFPKGAWTDPACCFLRFFVQARPHPRSYLSAMGTTLPSFKTLQRQLSNPSPRHIIPQLLLSPPRRAYDQTKRVRSPEFDQQAVKIQPLLMNRFPNRTFGSR